MKIVPTEDRVVVKVEETEEQTEGGIILPETYKEEKAQGVIVSVGPGKPLSNGKTQPVRLEEGQRIIFGKWAGEDVEVDKTKYKVVRSNDVLAILGE